MKIAISTKGLGGLGGQQRNIYSTIVSLEDCTFDIYTKKINLEGLFPCFKNVSVYFPKLMLGKLCSFFNPLKSYNNRKYDVYLHFFGGSYIGHKISAKKKFIVPSGHMVAGIERKFDAVLHQTPLGVKFGSRKVNSFVLPPPVLKSEEIQKGDNLPERYFLTVFNPYDFYMKEHGRLKAIKGHDVLYEVLEKTDRHIVWCHSTKSIGCAQNIKSHPRIHHLENVNQAQLRYLYEHAKAYICFSRSEGFGWAVADALNYHCPVISRYIGVLEFFPYNNT